MVLVGESETGRDALKDIPTKKIDIVVVDLALGDMSGLELIRELNREKNDFSILVLSMHDEDVFAERALKLGADGYLMKNTPPVEILEAIRQIARQEVALSKRQSDLMLKRILGRGADQGDSTLKLFCGAFVSVFFMRVSFLEVTNLNQPTNPDSIRIALNQPTNQSTNQL